MRPMIPGMVLAVCWDAQRRARIFHAIDSSVTSRPAITDVNRRESMLTPPVPQDLPSSEPWLGIMGSLCLGGALALLDLDHLAAAVLTAARAHMVGLLHPATVLAGHELRRRDEMMAATVPLVGPADSLLRKRSHD